MFGMSRGLRSSKLENVYEIFTGGGAKRDFKFTGVTYKTVLYLYAKCHHLPAQSSIGCYRCNEETEEETKV